MGLKKHGTTESRDILRNVYLTRPDPLSMPRSRHSFIILNCASHLTLTVYIPLHFKALSLSSLLEWLQISRAFAEVGQVGLSWLPRIKIAAALSHVLVSSASSNSYRKKRESRAKCIPGVSVSRSQKCRAMKT